MPLVIDTLEPAACPEHTFVRMQTIAIEAAWGTGPYNRVLSYELDLHTATLERRREVCTVAKVRNAVGMVVDLNVTVVRVKERFYLPRSTPMTDLQDLVVPGVQLVVRHPPRNMSVMHPVMPYAPDPYSEIWEPL